MKKKSYTEVCMKLILVKLIACGLDPPPFSIGNECRLQISFDVGEIHLYTLSLLWMIGVNMYMTEATEGTVYLLISCWYFVVL